jgi:hypothetical protein
MQSARDFCEEYIAAQIWPLKKGWGFVRFHEKLVKGKTYIFPDNEVFCPKKYTKDKDFVSAVEIKDVEILGKFLKKEKDLMDKILGSDYKRLNRIFDIAQIGYGERSAPAYTRSVKPSINNVTRKKRGRAPLTKKVSKKKAKTAGFSDSDVSENFVDEAFKKMSCDDEVRMFSLVFDSSGLTPPMLTPLDDYFQNLMANISHSGVAEVILSSSQQNVGEDTFPDPVNLVSSSMTVAATVVGSQEEGEVLASQETAGPSSQRFSVETPRDCAWNFGDGMDAVISSRGDANLGGEVIENVTQVVIENIVRVEQDAVVGSQKGASKGNMSGAKTQKIKGTTTVALDFDESDDEVHD